VRAFYDEVGFAFDRAVRQGLEAVIAGHPNARKWIIVLGEQKVGYAVLGLGFSLMYGGVDSFLDEIYVIPEFRRRGIAAAALALLAREATAVGANFIHLEVGHDNPALRLYRRAGYKDHDQYLLSLDLMPADSSGVKSI